MRSRGLRRGPRIPRGVCGALLCFSKIALLLVRCSAFVFVVNSGWGVVLCSLSLCRKHRGAMPGFASLRFFAGFSSLRPWWWGTYLRWFVGYDPVVVVFVPALYAFAPRDRPSIRCGVPFFEIRPSPRGVPSMLQVVGFFFPPRMSCFCSTLYEGTVISACMQRFFCAC